METIIKLPLYLKIETLQNVDRGLITVVAKEVLVARIIGKMKKGFTLNNLFSDEELTTLNRTLGSGAKIDILTEVQAIAKREG